MQGTLVVGGSRTPASAASVATAMRDVAFFWLDLDGVDEEASGVLRDTLGFHPLAVEDAEHFAQRPKIDEFDNFTFFVVHGALPDGGGLVEMHVFFTERCLVTVHRGDCPALADVFERMDHRHTTQDSSVAVTLLYMIVDTLVDSFFPVLSHFDDQVDQLEDDILRQPNEQQLGMLFEMKRSLIAMRKVVTPQRDMFAGLASGVVELPGMTKEGERYFRDLYDHLIRIADLVDSYRDLLSGVMDTHISTVSNRLNVVMKQLTIIATVFLPLSYLTGFFGQNFSFLIGHITGRAPFVFFGLGLEVFAALILLYFFRRRGWLGGPTT
ncbi:MAG TPA: magnesium/cobalt transporter CorA [Acidimicrobiales bacterium]|nr:magnesium/cobalt transporter CorA [Acidimicrobiales bacterium]